MKEQRTEIILPSKGETVAVAMKPKTAALCYDRVWEPPIPTLHGTYDSGPKDIICFGGTDVELEFVSLLGFASTLGRDIVQYFYANMQKSVLGNADDHISRIFALLNIENKKPTSITQDAIFKLIEKKKKEGRIPASFFTEKSHLKLDNKKIE